MKKEYILRGLDCANCAAKIEQAIAKHEGVSEASVNFIKGSLRVEWNESQKGITKPEIEKIIKRIESGVTVSEKTTGLAAPTQPAKSCCNHNHDTTNHTHNHSNCDGNHTHNHNHSNCDGNHTHNHDHSNCDGNHSHNHDHSNCDGNHSHNHDHSNCDGNHVHEHLHSDSNASLLAGRERAVATGRAADKMLIIRLIVGAIIFAAGLILEHAIDAEAYILIPIFAVGFLILGGDVLLKAFKNILRGRVFDENFLMAIATIGAFIIGEYAEGVGVMLFYQVGEMFQELAVKRAKKSITQLMDIRPDFASIKRGDELVKVSPESVQIGDIIVVKAGEKIPLDGEVMDGIAMLDTAALTGESVPRKAEAGDSVLSGSVNLSGVLTIKVTQSFGESTVSKIIDLVENATEKKAPTEKFITKFARYYTPAVVILAVLIAAIPPLFLGIGDGAIWMEWIRRGLIFLVISCPCALVISIPLGFFGGIGGASKKGVLIKGGNYLEALGSLQTVVFDKTGTLTKGVFEVSQIEPNGDYSKEDLLMLAAKAEAFSNHPIALSILREYEKEIDKSTLKDYTEIGGHGISVKDGSNTILAGNARLMTSEGIDFVESHSIGTKVYVASGGAYAGCITISDEIKPDARELIQALKARGIRTIMLTGDHPEIAAAVATEIGLDEVYGGLLPQQKVEKVEWLNSQKRKGAKLVFMGDGINDAPVLALSDIGISMGGLGSDAAIEAADIVIMTDEPSKLLAAIKTAKFTRRVVWQNIVFALAIKAVFLVLGALGIAGMWEAVFADVGVALLAVLNALRVMHKK